MQRQVEEPGRGRRRARRLEQQRIVREPWPVFGERAPEREVPPGIVGKERLTDGDQQQRRDQHGGAVTERRAQDGGGGAARARGHQGTKRKRRPTPPLHATLSGSNRQLTLSPVPVSHASGLNEG